MIQFESITVRRFALFPNVTLAFSTDAARPLTVIRGENESGKTTLMRAFVWALFGEGALPTLGGGRHAVRPIWTGADDESTTKVEIRFRSQATGQGSSEYKMSRTAETREQQGSVVYFNERETLLRSDLGEWRAEHDKLQVLLKRFFRPELRDFYFIDADKAQEYVGGPEAKHDDEVMRRSTTAAVRALFGLDVLRQTAQRLEDQHTTLTRQLARASSSSDQQELANQLGEADEELHRANKRLEAALEDEEVAEAEYHRLSTELEADFKRLEGMEQVNRDYEEAQAALNEVKAEQTRLLNELSATLDDDRLYTALMLPVVEHVTGKLGPMKSEGYIPPSELTLLPRLLQENRCVCGIDLHDHPDRRRSISERLQRSAEIAEDARFLDQMLERARQLGNRALGQTDRSWPEVVEGTQRALAELDPRLNDLGSRRDHLAEERTREGYKTAELREKHRHREAVKDQLDEIREGRISAEKAVAELNSKVRSLRSSIEIAEKRNSRNAELRSKVTAAEDLKHLIDAAYSSIETDQARDVSAAMNSLFRNVICATDRSLFAEIGLRAVRGRRGLAYEPYACDSGGEKPLALANGASRRAIAVTFVLALAEMTGTKVPLVADSLLHSLSGIVKRNVVNYLTSGDRVGQPILFVTRDDVLDRQVSDFIKARAGSSYTLTSQTHVGGDVLRATDGALPNQVVVCACGIDSFCTTCERRGDRDRTDLHEVPSQVIT